MFNATFNNISVISWRSVLLVWETAVPRENHRPVASHWQTWSHNVVSSTPRLRVVRTHNVLSCETFLTMSFSRYNMHKECNRYSVGSSFSHGRPKVNLYWGWWGVFKILQYSIIECNCVRKITEGLFRKYSTLWQHTCESLITVLKILYTLVRGPLNLKDPRLQPIAPIGKSGTDLWCCSQISWRNYVHCVLDCASIWSKSTHWLMIPYHWNSLILITNTYL